MAENDGAPGKSGAGPAARGLDWLEALGVHAKRIERPANEREAQEVLARASGSFVRGTVPSHTR